MDDKIMRYNNDVGLYDYINPTINLKDLNRKQVKELAKEIAGGKGLYSWQEVDNNNVEYSSKNNRQEKRFKRIFNKQLNENLSPILEKQHKQELIDRMKSGDASAMSQYTTEGINKFGHQFMPIMLTAATLPFGLGAFGQSVNTLGLIPAIGAEATSLGLGYGGYKLGEKLDDSFGTNWIAPVASLTSGIGGYGAGYKGTVKLGSRGWLPKSDKFIYGSQFIGDVVADGIKRGIRTTRLKQPILEPVMRFKLGDIEINDPNLYYRQGTKEMGDDLIESGVVRGTNSDTMKKNYPVSESKIQLTKAFPKPMFNQGKLFFGVNENFPDLIVAGPDTPMFPAHKGGNIVDDISINSVNVKDRRIPGIKLTSDQVSLYRLDPNYGYRVVKPETPTIDRIFGIQNRVFRGNSVFQKDNWAIPSFNTSSAYRLTGQSQIDDMIQTGFIRPRAGKIKGGHVNEVHWSVGQPRSGYNGTEGQYVLEAQLGLVDGTNTALNVRDLSHIWTVRNGKLVDIIDEVRPYAFKTTKEPYVKVQSSIVNQPTGKELVTPLDALDAIKKGRTMAGSFFKHPVVKESYAHNQALAKRLGINLPDRPADISEMVTRPVKVGWITNDNEIANVAQGYYGDPDVTMNFQWRLRPKSEWEHAARHESMHLGYYSAPIRPEKLTQDVYNTITKPTARFWKWKTDKLLRPEYRDGYLSDVWGGEAGPNLIDMGRDLNLKLGQKYPGDTEFLNMMNNYKGFKSQLVPHLQLDTRAGRRHVWDAMTGKYFTIPAAGLIGSKLVNTKNEELQR